MRARTLPAGACLLLFTSLVVATFVVGRPGPARAEDAQVLPKGVSRVTLDDYIYVPVTQRWNPEGKAEDLAGDFNNRPLDGSVFSDLADLDSALAAFGLSCGGVGPGPGCTIGTSQVKFEYHYNILDFGFQHGLTDRLTVGIDIPYYWADNSVKAKLDSSNANANVGIATGSGGLLCDAIGVVRPLFCPNTRRFTTDDVQQLLAQRFGFKPIKNFSADGFGDITVGAKYQFFRSEDARGAGTFAVRLPTGRQDDPDDLSDIAWSSGAWALLFRLHGDYTLSNLWRRRAADVAPAVTQAGDLVLGLTFRFDWVLPDEATMRIPSDVTNPINNNRERVDRNLGDRYEIEVSGKYQLTRDFSLSALYRYAWKQKDDIDGKLGFAYNLLEEETDSTEQIYIVQLGYSTVPLYQEKKFPVPMGVTVGYRDRFAGSGPHSAASPSQILKSRYILVGVQVFF